MQDPDPAAAPGDAGARPRGDASAPVVVFDLDGVLVHGDLLGSFVRRRLRRSPRHLVAFSAAWPWLAGPVLLRPTRALAVRELLRIAFAGMGDEEYAAQSRAFAAEVAADPSRVVHQAIREVQGLLAEGARVVIVTACERRIAQAYVEAVGLAGVLVLGAELAFGGRLGLRVVRANHGPAKVDALRRAGIHPRWAVAYTDALSDLPLLERADQPVLVNPDGWLRRRVARGLGRPAAEVHWLGPPN